MNQEPVHGGETTPLPAGAPYFPPLPDTSGSAPPVPYVPKPRPPVPVSKKDSALAFLCLLLGYLFLWLVFPFQAGFGVTLFAFCFFGVSFYYFHQSGAKLTGRGRFVFILSLLSALNFSLFSNYTLSFFNLLFLMACAVYWISCLASTRLSPELGSCFPADLENHFFRIPFLNFDCGAVILKHTAKQYKKGKGVLAVLAGVAAAFPLLLITISLLSQVDDTFQSLVSKAVSPKIGEEVFTALLRLIVSLPVGCYLCGLLYGAFHKRHTGAITTESVEKKRSARRVLPAAMVMTVLCLLCGVYLLFFVSQITSLCSAFLIPQTGGFSYSNYARKGFFELCMVASLNFAILTLVYLFAARRDLRLPSCIRRTCACLSGATLLLIGTAFSKMALYISRFGLTQKRVYTSWFMLLLFLLFCILLAAQIKPIHTVKCMVLTVCLCFMALCYGNVDSLIVSSNVNRYLSGSLPDLDIHSFYSMPYAAAPHAQRLLDSSSDPELREKLAHFLERGLSVESPLQSGNLQILAAEKYWSVSDNI